MSSDRIGLDDSELPRWRHLEGPVTVLFKD